MSNSKVTPLKRPPRLRAAGCQEALPQQHSPWPLLASAPQLLEQEPLGEATQDQEQESQSQDRMSMSPLTDMPPTSGESLCSSDSQPFVSDLLGSVHWPDCPRPSLPLPLCFLASFALSQETRFFYFFLNKASELESVEFKFRSKQLTYPAVGARWAHSSSRAILTPQTGTRPSSPIGMPVYTLDTHTCTCAHTVNICTYTLEDACIYTTHIHRLVCTHTYE